MYQRIDVHVVHDERNCCHSSLWFFYYPSRCRHVFIFYQLESVSSVSVKPIVYRVSKCLMQAYGRVTTLESHSPVFSLLQSGNILLLLTSYAKVSISFFNPINGQTLINSSPWTASKLRQISISSGGEWVLTAKWLEAFNSLAITADVLPAPVQWVVCSRLHTGLQGYPSAFTCCLNWDDDTNGIPSQAIETFQEALEKAPQHVGGLCGLAAAMLGRSRECMVMGAFAWSASLAKVCWKFGSHFGSVV